MSIGGLHIFDTAIGPCGSAWREQGIVGLQLAEGSAAATLARLRKRFPELDIATPGTEVSAVEASVIALLAGGNPDLDFIHLDMRAVPDFHRQVYAIVRAIPRGETLSHGDIARRLGDLGLSRAVGQAMGANPFAPVVPCHRVMGANGLGGFSAHGGAATKRRLLALEGTPNVQLSMFDT
ncbi:MAG: methylated-DNA--[protein]-cysteine S-methyltransferase [Proteobacteria bacterium]|nr:methylated-DNA--[protein]-cysteine S-methyltransferase [Pseudomonadota bacterium]